MSIEIKNLSIKSSIIQRAGSGADDDDGEQAGEHAQGGPRNEDWRAECRRMIMEALDARRER